MDFFGKEAIYEWQTKDLRDRLITWQFGCGQSYRSSCMAFDDIVKYGSDIMETQLFADAFKQTHHNVSTVGEHTLHVAFKALEIAYKRRRRGKLVNIEYVVQAALSHDLGIIGRYEKYANNLVCCFMHPIDSSRIIRDMFPNIAYEVTAAIENHMFPATIIPPTTLTGKILIKADKSAALREVYFLRSRKVREVSAV
ncbi:HD domain-containing protein [Butyrivibrio sp. JL13D10]|uniref:HD domain-containing protein n=1 Tax=Butyrivibrio sp. JL13D10 TaxID=3236815 RepID=UPI0038B5BCB2